MKQLPKLLIVDDNPDNLFLLRNISRKVEVELIQALSGAEALEKIRGIELALAIIDVRMPEMSGYELARKMNEERMGDKVPIIFLTASDEKNAFEGYDSGAVDYINQPVPNHVILGKLKVFLDLFNQKQIIVRNSEQLKKSADELNNINIALKRSEEKYRSYIDNAPDGVFVIDETGRFLEVNDSVCNITGYSKSELLALSVQDLILPEFQNVIIDQLKSQSKDNCIKADLSVRHKQGIETWLCMEVISLEEFRLLGFIKDITDRKKIEEELKLSLEQLRQLAKYKEKARESERKSVARELHDDLGQALTAVKIDLGLIKQNVTNPDVLAKITKVTGLVSDTIKSVQRLTSQLRPEIIDDLGLDAAIKWYTKEFSQRSNIEIFLDMDSSLEINPENSLTLFRIMQESLTNIVRHAKASRVEIALTNMGDKINFRITDDGIGIDEIDLDSKKSFGIMGMKERAASLGGTCNIFNANGKGAIVDLIFPARQ
ncbi:MAG: PAS domain S-box protein [Prolixibacteraceae bacterium]